MSSGTITNSTLPGIASDSPSVPPRVEPLPLVRSHWFGWAAFLGMSWTWCIGMFLPVLLVRDFGILAWVIFAIPNVVGAAAMGWVIRTPAQSAAIAWQHRYACQIFSAVTMAFHLFFVVAVLAPLSLSLVIPGSRAMDASLGTVLVASILFYVYMIHRGGADRTLAYVVLVVSMALMVLTTVEIRDIALSTPERMPPIPQHPLDPHLIFDLLSLTPVCVFGFLFCPYLDLTFHRARQQSPQPRRAFGVGFGVCFFLAIIFTLIYAVPIISGNGTLMIGIFLFAYMAMQIAFTLSAHARELRHGATLAIAITIALTLGAWACYWYLPDRRLIAGLRSGEIIYRIFMGFYGLIFPAYVWLVMLPARGQQAETTSPTPRKLAIHAVAVAIALPLFWRAFVARQMIWIIPGIAVVLLARSLVPAGKRREAIA